MKQISANITGLIDAEVAWRYKVIPVGLNDQNLTLLIDTSEYGENITGEIELITGYQVTLIKEEKEIIARQLSQYYRKNSLPTSSPVTETEAFAEDFLLKIVNEAKSLRSSDIHIEGYAEKCRIRLRIDGKLIERYNIPKAQYSAFINKIKIRANLDIAEKRLPQDGRILLHLANMRIDIRVSVLPALYGEKIVLRLLGTDSSHLHMEQLGFSTKQLADVVETLKKQQGIVLISGPTGSGKTTTLYSMLKLLNKEHSNILTIEDPIEYTLDGINQVQLHEHIGLTFSSALRTFLRQDPDIIMLGEIRDAETAQMAIRAALTGHLVLSTIHTNSAWGTISRLIDMGVPSFLLAGTLNLSIAQRLVRRLCIHCRKEETRAGELYRGIEGIHIHYVPSGCDQCFYTGYSGRMAIYEVIPVDKEISFHIRENTQEIEKQLTIRNINTLQHSALNLVRNGITSIEEIYPILLNH